MAKQLNARIITKHDTEENWNRAESFIPKLGEIIVTDVVEGTIFSQYHPETLPRIKIGDGKTLCKDLHYITDAYVIKERNKQLSEKNYTQTHYDIVDKIANLGYEPVFRDTTYTAGKGLGSRNNEFYSTGVIGISTSSKNGCFKYTYSTGPNSTDYVEDDIRIWGLTDTAFTPITEFLTKDTIVNINNAVTEISSDFSDDKIYITYKNAVGESTTFPLPQLGKLAFKDGFDGDFAEVTEVAVQHVQPIGNIPIWISLTDNNEGTLNFFDPYEKVYKAVQSGSFVNASNFFSDEIIDGIQIITKNQTLKLQIGVTDIRKGDLANTLKTRINGTESYIDITPTVSFSAGKNPGSFGITIGNNPEETVSISGLGSNAFSSTAYLPLAGGTVTGITAFTSTSAASSTTTGAVRISGGLGVQGSIYGNKVFGSVYNDYAEYRQAEGPIEPGYIVYSGDDGVLHKTVGRLQFFEGVISDTFGFSIGKTDKAQTPLAVAGRVLVYTDEELHAGNVVCAGPHGKACKMTKKEIKEHPDRIVGIVSEVPNYETWGEENIPVNGRVWIRVK